jgi:hypothetical protein
MTFSDLRPSAPPAVSATLAQAAGEETTKLIAARFGPAFTFNPAFAVTGCGGQDLALARCPESSRLGTATAKSAFGEASGPISLTSDFHIFIAYGAYEGLVKFRVFGSINALDDGSAELTIEDLPSVPVTEAKLELLGGARAIFVNPRRCGRYRVGSRFVSHNGSVATATLPVDIAPCSTPLLPSRPAIAPARLAPGGSAVLRWSLPRAALRTEVTLFREARGEWVQLATRRGPAARGRNALRVGPRWGGRRLTPGAYRASLRVVGAGGVVGPARTVPFGVRG